jgi:large subunit ribosomal protein L15
MQRRFPKKGFKNPFRQEIFAVNVGALEKRFPAGIVDLAALQGAGMVPRSLTKVKILGEGDLTKKLTVKASAFSASAKEKIEKAGGKAEVVGGAPAAAAG